MKADAHLDTAAQTLRDRAVTRDAPDGERSMAATVTAFNAIFGTELTEEMGWQFMAILKIRRGSQGIYVADDYTDQAAYSALAGEAAERERATGAALCTARGTHRFSTGRSFECEDCGADIRTGHIS